MVAFISIIAVICGCITITGACLLVYYRSNSSDELKSHIRNWTNRRNRGNQSKHIKCSCGSTEVKDMLCYGCHQVTTGCEMCRRCLSPCACGEQLPPVMLCHKEPELKSGSSTWIRCSCGCKKVNKMQCDKCEQPVIGCAECKTCLSVCSCKQARQTMEASSTADTMINVDEKQMRKLKRLLQKLRRTVECESTGPQPEQPTDQRAESEQNDEVQSLKKQVDLLMKQNGELTETISKCARDGATKTLTKMNAFSNGINQSEPSFDIDSMNLVSMDKCNPVPIHQIPRCHIQALRKLHQCKTSQSKWQKKLKVSMKQNAELIGFVGDLRAKLKVNKHKQSKKQRVYYPEPSPYGSRDLCRAPDVAANKESWYPELLQRTQSETCLPKEDDSPASSYAMYGDSNDLRRM